MIGFWEIKFNFAHKFILAYCARLCLMVFIDGYEFKIIERVAIAFIIGVIIGFDRERSGKAAGIRTQMLVSVGSALMASISVFLGPKYGIFTADPARLMAQIITGVGFLGAGVILKNGNNKVVGVTTAATIWTTAALGIAVGAGFFIPAIFVTFLVLLLNPIAYFQYKYGLKGDYYLLKVALKDESKLEKILSDMHADVRKRAVKEDHVLATFVSSQQRNVRLRQVLTKNKIKYELDYLDE